MHFNRIYIEVSNICNLQCHFCPEVERANQILSLEKFTSILREVAPYTDQVCLHVMGEPLAHPEFSELVGECGQQNLKVQITTNATLLRGKNVLALLSPQVRQVNISLQSFAANLKSDEKSLGSCQVKLQQYLDSIFEFSKKAQALRPDLFVQFRMWNEGALESALEAEINSLMLKKVEEYFSVKIDFSKIDLQFKKSFPLGGRFSIQFDSRFRWPNMKDDILSEIGFCHALSSHIAIHADGKVVPCCLDKEAKINLGNIFETRFSEILEGSRLNKMKSGFAAGKLCEDLCQRCDFVTRFAGKAKRISLKNQIAKEFV